MKIVKNHWRRGKKILVTYAGEKWDYRCARIMYILGKQNARPGSVGTIVSPKQAKGIIIDSAIPDVKVFSFTFEGKLRQLLIKIHSDGGSPSSCTVRLIRPRTKGKWESLSGDVTLGVIKPNEGFTPVLFNPHALAEWGDMIYLIDYESKVIVILGADELEGMSGDYVPMKHPFDLSGHLENMDARGQALAAAENKLLALYQVPADPNAARVTPGAYGPSVLLRLDIGSDGNLSIDTQTNVGRNARGISLVLDGTELQVLVHAIGGPQELDGTTNGVFSNVCCVPLNGVWPAEADILITGDPVDANGKSNTGTYNILGLAASARGRSGMLYLLTQIYLTGSDGSQDAMWRIYEITVGEFLDLFRSQSDPAPEESSDPPPPYTLTEALAHGLDITDEGAVESLKDEGVYYWDIIYGQAPGVNDADDRLWVILGTPLMVTRAAKGEYGSPTSDSENPYVIFGFNGGHNTNCLDLTIEAITHVERGGGVSQRRSMHGAALSVSASK